MEARSSASPDLSDGSRNDVDDRLCLTAQACADPVAPEMVGAWSQTGDGALNRGERLVFVSDGCSVQVLWLVRRHECPDGFVIYPGYNIINAPIARQDVVGEGLVTGFFVGSHLTPFFRSRRGVVEARPQFSEQWVSVGRVDPRERGTSLRQLCAVRERLCPSY